MAPPRISSFLVKIASRCNLDCDYCYVYHHADQSWRSMPRLLSAENRTAFAGRLAEYAEAVDLKQCVVVLHGGEPLLAGTGSIVSFVQELRSGLRPETELDVGLQTNGLLLTEDVLDQLEAAGVSISLSLDGPRAANDLHRNSRAGRSSFDRVLTGLERLKARPGLFAGIIAVIDPRTAPEDLFAFFDEHAPPKLDFLLPDAHHMRQPPGRDAEPDLYRDWWLRAFDVWFDRYPHMSVRTFEALLDAVAGLPSGTDAFGLGDVSLISIETDGSYHDLDVFKVVGEGATRLSGSVQDTAIADVAASPALAIHRSLLTKAGLAPACVACPVVDVCGGGSLPHRFGPDGFNQPSVYCHELLALISHVRQRLAEGLKADPQPAKALPDHFDLAGFEVAETAGPAMKWLCDDARMDAGDALREALTAVAADNPSESASDAGELLRLPRDRLDDLALEPGAMAWSRTYLAGRRGRTLYDIDGVALPVDAHYVSRLRAQAGDPAAASRVGHDDPWLHLPFGTGILFEPADVVARAQPLVQQALAIIAAWRPALAAEMAQACRAVQFVRDPSAHPEKIVSFSDNSVPGALYVSVLQGDQLIGPYDLADSLIHEHRHQKLYLLERFGPMVEPEAGLVVSPWREDLRPPSGLLHAIFVFVELRRFWIHVRDREQGELRRRAITQLADTERHLAEAFETLRSCALTSTGQALAGVLERTGRREPAAA